MADETYLRLDNGQIVGVQEGSINHQRQVQERGARPATAAELKAAGIEATEAQDTAAKAAIAETEDDGLDGLTKADLRIVAEEEDVTFRVGMTNADLVAAIRAARAANAAKAEQDSETA